MKRLGRLGDPLTRVRENRAYAPTVVDPRVIPEPLIGEFLGHTTVKTTMKYVHLLPNQVQPDW